MSLFKVASVVITGVLFSSFALAQTAPTQPTYVNKEAMSIPTVQNNVDYIAGYVQKLQSYKPHGKSAIQKLTELVEQFRKETGEGIAQTQAEVETLSAAIAEAAGVLYDIDATSQTISVGVQALQGSVNAVAAGVAANQQGIQANQATLVTVVAGEEAIKAALAKQQAELEFYQVEQELATKAYTVSLYKTGTGGRLELARDVVAARYSEVESSNKHSKEAAEDIAKGNNAFAAGNNKEALNNYGKAYRELVRVNFGGWAHSPFSR